jgi:putative membrane protein
LSKRSIPMQDVGHVVRGLLMGGADVVPGVSGGTVALIVGIYERLVAAISHVDLELLALARQRRWSAAARHLDLRFLVALALGILLGVVTLGGLVNHLLTTEATRGPTLAAFLGMILASCVLVARLIPRDSSAGLLVAVVCGAAGIAFAAWLTGLPTTEADPSFGYVFLCGMVAICAMILPGISGAYVLLILGLYLHLTDILKRLPSGQVGVLDALTVAVFGTGCAIGLIGFSKVLRRLLARFPGPTMAVLCGFMIGALRRVWPFQVDTTPEIEKLRYKVYANVWPERFDGEVLTALIVAVVAIVVVFAVDRLARARPSVPDRPEPA